MVFIYFILFITCLLFYILYKGAFSFYLFIFITALPIILNLLLSYSKKRIKVSFLDGQRTACRAVKIPVVIKIENTSFVPIPNCIISIAYTSKLRNDTEVVKINSPIFPKNTQYLTVGISAKHYGSVHLKINKVRIVDMLKMFKRTIKPSSSELLLNESIITIIPDYIALENPIANYADMGLETDSYSKTKSGDDASEIFDIHEYKEGDKINRIHWKLTAKQDKTMVKDYSLPIANSLLIVVDLYSDNKNDKEKNLFLYDTLVETVSAISMHLVENECPHKVLWYDGGSQSCEIELVSSIDNYRLMISRLLQSQTYAQEDKIASCLADTSEMSTKFGHLIYCTAHNNNGLYNILTDFDMPMKYTVMKMIDEGEDLEYFSDEKFTFIAVSAGNISESVHELCL